MENKNIVTLYLNAYDYYTLRMSPESWNFTITEDYGSIGSKSSDEFEVDGYFNS